MTLGSLARTLLGDRAFVRVADAYRAIFVNLDALVDCLPRFAPGTEILDVGGGDGAVLDRVLARNPGVSATLVDLAPQVGVAIAAERRERVRLLPATRVAALRERGAPAPDVVICSDLLHHVPPDAREALLREVRDIAGERALLIVKDVAPGGLRAGLSVFADRWISGDRGVQLIGPRDACALVARVFPSHVADETPLLDRDRPNYCIVFAPPPAHST